MKEEIGQNPPPDEAKQRDFYQKLRRRVARWAEGRDATTTRGAELVLLAPDLFHLCCRLLADKRVPAKAKGTLGLVVAYFISPIDLMPEALLGPLGYADDVALAVLALHHLMDSVPEAVLREQWAGDEDILRLVETLVATLHERLDQKVLRRLRKLIP